MIKSRKKQETVNTPMRERLSKEMGKEKLGELEKLIIEEVPSEGIILETPARERLRKIMGKEELKRIEAKILMDAL